MNWMLLALALFVVAMVAMQVLAVRRARRSEGASAPDTSEVDGPALSDPVRVYFFHAEHCGPCRAVAPLVHRLNAVHRNLIVVDVVRWPQLAQAFSIAATPSFVAVEDGRIREVRLGGQSEAALLRMLQPRSAG